MLKIRWLVSLIMYLINAEPIKPAPPVTKNFLRKTKKVIHG